MTQRAFSKAARDRPRDRLHLNQEWGTADGRRHINRTGTGLLPRAAARRADAGHGRRPLRHSPRRRLREGGTGFRRGTAKVAAGVAVFVEPAARGRNIGEVLFKEAMRACRALDFRYMLFVERDGGSGKLIKWYEAMGFRVVPPDVLPGLDRAMVGYLPSDQTFYDARRGAGRGIIVL